jgi:hypothetical protein
MKHLTFMELLKGEDSPSISGEGMKKGVVFAVIILLLSGVSLTQTSAYHHAASSLDVKEWTFMVYLDGDCDLEAYQIDAFLRLGSVGSTADVNILVQFDRIGGYDSRYGDWEGCKRFYVTSGMTPEGYNALSHLGEPSMGDPATLRNFVVWGINQYPAEKYALILSNHGDNGGVCEDLTGPYDYLSNVEVYEAMANVQTTTGETIDLIGYAACLMGAVEVVYHSGGWADVIVASEELCGEWYFDDVLTELTAAPDMNSSVLAEWFVYYYMLFNQDSPFRTHATLSAFNLTMVTDNVIASVNALAIALNQTVTTYCYDIMNAMAITEYAQGAAEFAYAGDLYHFAESIKATIPDSLIQVAAQDVMDAINEGQIIEWHGSSHPNYHGLSIYLPPTIEAYHSRTGIYSLDNLLWIGNNLWDDFLKSLYITYAPGIQSQETLSDISYTSFDSDADDYLDAIRVNLDADTNGEAVNVSVHGLLLDPLGTVVDTCINWTQASFEDIWCSLDLFMPTGGEAGWYDLELFLYDQYGVLEDHSYYTDVAFLPEEMQHSVAVNDVLVTRTAVGQGFTARINITIENMGHYTETFNVTTQANGTLINSTPLILPSSSTAAYTVYWNTADQVMGNYTITVQAEPVDNEANITDNMLSADSDLCITIAGDVDADHDVDIFDILQIADSYGTHKGSIGFLDNCDIDDDGDVDIFDVTTAVHYYGISW